VPYQAPEVLDGRDATTQSDAFSAGAVAYHALTGRRPWEPSMPEPLRLAQRRIVPAPCRSLNPEVPAVLARAVDLALALEPARRPTPDDLRLAVRTVCGAVPGLPRHECAGAASAIVLDGAATEPAKVASTTTRSATGVAAAAAVGASALWLVLPRLVAVLAVVVLVLLATAAVKRSAAGTVLRRAALGGPILLAALGVLAVSDTGDALRGGGDTALHAAGRLGLLTPPASAAVASPKPARRHRAPQHEHRPVRMSASPARTATPETHGSDADESEEADDGGGDDWADDDDSADDDAYDSESDESSSDSSSSSSSSSSSVSVSGGCAIVTVNGHTVSAGC
jgi:hypothetical protein